MNMSSHHGPETTPPDRNERHPSLFTDPAMLVGQVRAMVTGARSRQAQLPGVLAMADALELLADRVEAIDRTLTKPNGVITNDWHYTAVSEARQIARGRA